jgi:hypothetical protein
MGRSSPDDAYGGFIVSRRVLEGVPFGFSSRERSAMPQLNGWTVYSVRDDESYARDPSNFRIVSASTLLSSSPLAGAMLEVFDAPYGTDLGWVWEGGALTGLWDMAHDRPVTVAGALAGEAVAG